MVDLGRDGVELLLDGHVELIAEAEVVGLVAQAHDLVGQGLAALAALCPHLGERHVHAQLLALGLDEVELGLGVGREGVDGHDAGQAIDVLDVGDVLQQVGHASLERLEVLRGEVGLGHAAVVLECADGGHDHHGAGLEARGAALDVKELLGAQVSTEAGLGHHVVSHLHGGGGCHDGVAAVGNVGKRAAVDERGIVLQRLDQVGLDGVLQKRGAGALGVEVVHGDRLAVVGVGNHHAAKAGLQVIEVARQAEGGHDLGGNGDVEAVLTGHAVGDATHAVNHVTKLAVVHVDATAPNDAARVDVELVVPLDGVVEHGRDEVVGRADGVEVTGEVQVDVLHGNDLGIAAAGGAALDAKHGAEGRLAQAEHRLAARKVHGISQTDGGRGLALACRRRVDGRNEDKLCLGGHILHGVDVNLGLGAAVVLELVFGEAGLGRNLADGKHRGFLRDLDIALVVCHLGSFLVRACAQFPQCHHCPSSDMSRRPPFDVNPCKTGI